MAMTLEAVPAQYDVCLLSMPFPVLNQPSMALGLLKPALTQAGLSVKTLYPCLWFAEEVGLDAYVAICDSKQEFLVGEWIFAEAAFPGFQPDLDTYLERVLSAPVSRGLLKKSRFSGDPHAALRAARQAAKGFIERVAARVLELQPRIVGCTSTFTQHCASLAVLRKIRELAPEVVTVMGGANCEGEMGVSARRNFPWVDFVVSGEGELLFPKLCQSILEHGRDIPAQQLPHGLIGEAQLRLPAGAPAPRASVTRMDTTPVPDFDDYFEEILSSPLRPFIFPGLAMETSRGCWWGKKHHCTFCGLNGGNMDFRSKSADRVISELSELSTKYGIRKFNIVDNIMDLAYIQDLAPRITSDTPYTLFFETKVNLKRAQLERIAAAGIRRLQPGVESMHDEILRLVDKGTTALQNIQLLKWAREIGIFITWNFLWDVPGEQDAWYGEMAAWLPWVTHLQPPGVDRIQFHRFSPYHQRPASFGLTLEPYPLYSHVYPLTPEELGGLAYYFHDPRRRSAKEELERRPHLRQTMREIAQWNKLWNRGGFEGTWEKPVLRMFDEGERLRLMDTRPCAPASEQILTGLAKQVYQQCDAIQTLKSLLEGLAKHGVEGASPGDVQAILDDLVKRKLLLRQGERFIALALREISRIPDSDEDFPGGYTDVDAWRQALTL
ncbi:RiPP maturation radical SAM C-methyltransferase [Stigmatella aurantiaca]|uniref:Radical SAM n=2 Tax=Stigmatella aurantiaca (strain DW4/3-1) TaxID=378806 RepID=Q08PP1_STIAD|nr:RiPP maturation radical SAM C-methyltransferase [Stigmatella aurantiaca]EAU62452.1 radical SAM [Stigmatella aurantiaca DW4/3-1]